MIDDEIVLTGVKAKRLLSLENFPESNLFGAELYDGNDAGSTIPVVRFTPTSIITANQTYPHSWLNKSSSEIIFTRPNEDLRKCLAQLLTVGELRAEQIDSRLKAIGCPVEATATDVDDREFLITLIDCEDTPSERDRIKFFAIAQQAEPLHWSVRFFERWLRRLETESSFNPIARMHLAYVFRHTRQLEKAIKVSAVVEFGRDRFNCSTRLLSIIATIRAATLLDIYDLHNDPEILNVAKLTLAKAWANQKTEEVSSVYQRLDRLRRSLDELNYKKKVSEAYIDWAAWV